MKLLLLGRVSRVILNDVDPAVYSMWDAIVNHPDELCAFIEGAELSITEWKCTGFPATCANVFLARPCYLRF